MSYDDLKKKYGLGAADESSTEQKPASDSNTYESLLNKYEIKHRNQERAAAIDALNRKSRLSTDFKINANILDAYSKRIANEEYLTQDEIDEYSKAAVNYLNVGSQLISSEFGATKEDIDNWQAMQAQIATSTAKAGKFYTGFADAEDYDFWRSRNTVEKRQALYEEQKARVAELEKMLSGASSSFGPSGFKNMTSNYEKELETLKAEMANYERGNTNENGRYYGSKVVDDYYHVTQNDDFDRISADRNYGNPDLSTLNTPNNWAYDEYGVYRDVYGNEIKYDGFGNPINPMNDVTVEDKLGLYLNATQEQRAVVGSGEYGMNNELQQAMYEGNVSSWEYLNDDEIGIYYYLLRKEGRDSAYKFLDDMAIELDRRRTLSEQEKEYEEYQNASFLGKVWMNIKTIPKSVAGGVVGTIGDAIHGDDYNPYARYHGLTREVNTVRGATAADLDDVGIIGDFFTLGDLYQSGMSLGDSMLAMGVGGGWGGAFLAMSAAENEAIRLYESGASTDQIFWGSITAGATEMIFESISIGELQKIKNMSIPAAGQYIKAILVQGGVEASEEILTEISNTIANAYIMGSQSDWEKLKAEYGGDIGQALMDKTLDVLHAGISGFASGTGSGSVYGGVSRYKTNSEYRDTGRTIMSADGGVKALQDLAMAVAGDTSGKMSNNLKKQAGKVSDAVTGNGIGKIGAALKNRSNATKVGRLASDVATANKVAYTAENQADIAKSLQRKGLTADTANDIASALVAQYNGQSLTKAQEKLLESIKDNPDVQKTISNIITNKQSTLGQRQNNIRDFQNAVNDGIFASKHGLTVETYKNLVKSAQLHQETKTEAPAVESNYKVSADGNAYDSNGNAINIVGVDSVKDGKLILKTENGTIDSSEVEYATGSDALIYDAVAQTGASPASAWAMINGFKESDGVSAQDYARDISLAYKYGKLNFKSGLQTLDLTAKQKNDAFQMGRDDAEASVKATPKKSTESTIGEKNADKEIIFEGFTYDKKRANEVQKASMEAIDVINKMSSLEIHVYQSVKKNGKLYATVNGTERLAPNGYFTDGNKIYIDINAGNMGEGLMLYTLSHEVGHYIAKWNAQDFKAISDFLFEHYGKDVPIYDLLEEQKNKLKESYKRDGKEIPSEAQIEKLAHEELVCDMLSRMLADKNAYDKLMELKQKDLNVFQKLGQAIKEALDKLAKVLGIYDTLNPDAKYAASVENFGEEAFRQLQDLYMRAFVQADANFQAAQKNTTEDGGENTEDDIKLSPREENAFKQFAGKVNSVINQSITGKGHIDGKVQVVDIMPVGPRLAAMVSKSSGGAIDISQRRIALNTGEVWHEYDRHTSVSGEVSRNQIAFTKRQFQNAVKCMISPDMVETIFADANNPTQRQSFAYAKKTRRGHYVVVEAVGGKKNPQIYPVMIVQFTKAKWDKMIAEGKSLGEILHEGETQKLLAQNVEENKKSRVTAAQFASYEAIANTLRSPQLDDMISQPATEVKNESTEAMDLELDAKTESVAPTVLKSERTWTESDYVKEREQAAKEIAKAIGVSVKKAKAYIDSVNSIAKMIAEDRVRLDYFSSPGRSSFVSNVEYGGSFDFSTLCKKRRLLTGTFTAIQKALPNTALTANEILDIRNRMKKAGLEVSCGLCYVEGSRANMGQFAKEFLKLYKQYYPDAWQPNMADVNTPDGIEWVRINHPEAYEQYEYFWNHYGTLKPGDKNLFASQQKPKLYQLHTEYKGEILDKFKDDDSDTVEEKNLNGGIRLQSFSDFEIVHLIDTMQIIMDMSRVGLAGQAYTKVPDFAWALGDTGLKINLSLIAKGVDENGKLIFDDVEGMPIDEAMKLRDRYSKNVGTILVAFNDEQLLAAMADERVDFIIPFHRSQWKKSQYEAMGLPTKTKDYTYMQNEKFIKPQFHEYRGRMVKDKATNYMPNEYWDFSKSGKENAEAYLEMCARNNKRPKFYKLLQNNGDGSYSLKADGSTDGYWKLLIDFKMYDNSGKGSPQLPVKPDFNMDEATRMLDEYKGGHSNFPVAQGVVDEFVSEYKDSHKGTMYSDRDSQISEQTKFSMRDTVEETKDLLAFHNITPQLLREALNRKGLLMPSLAITNKGMNDFGEISLLFDKSTIDPNKSRDNKLYGADAWTPTQTNLKKNAKFDTDKTVRAVNAMKVRIGSKYVSELLDINPKQFRDTILQADGSIYDAYAHHIGVQTAYAMESGIISKIPTNKNGTVDKVALQEQINKELDTDNGWRQYKKWLNNISDTIITSYDKASNEDILNNMKAQPASAKTFKLSETGELVVPAAEYSSIKDLRKNKSRLSENAEEAAKAVADEFMTLAKSIGNNTKTVVNAINTAFAARYNTADIMKAFRKQGIDISTKTAGELQSLYKKAVELPTQYFEAKPGREVGLDEIKAVVMPNNSSPELRGALEDLGVEVIEYDGTKESRTEALNSVDSLKFSDRDSNYLDAVKRGDMKTAQKMVNEAAKESGYTTKGYHGTSSKFTSFNTDIIYFSVNKNHAKEYGENILGLYVKADKPYISKDGVIRADNGNPFMLDGEEVTVGWLDAAPDALDYLISKGYDAAWDEDMEYAAVFSAENVKSSDPVTYDKDGNVIPLSQRFNQANDDIRYSDRDYVAYDRTAILKESKVDEYLEDYAAVSTPKYAQAYITYMRPRTFLKLTTDGFLERIHISEQAGELDAERLNNSRPGIYLRIDHDTGKVIGHEGRHRMSAMENAHINLVPVLLLDDSNKNTKTDIDQMYLHGQFDETEIGVVKDIIPLSYENRGRIIEKFATQSTTQRIGERYGISKTLRFQERTEDSVSNRSLLANAFEGVAQNDIERNKIKEYKEKIDLINAEEQKLNDLNEQIKELSFAKGPRDTKKIRGLQLEANQAANRISVYDKQLLRLEASKPLQDVLNREKKKAYKRAEQKGKDALAAYKEKTAKTQRELLDRWQDSRKKGIEGRHKTAMRHKIKDIVNELNQYLLRGTKDRHVPIELQKAVAEALDAVNMDTVGAEERIAKLKAELMKAKTPEQIQEISRKIDRVQQMGDKMNGRLQKLKDAYDQFVNSDDPMIANSHDEVISNKLESVIEDIGNTPLRDMTLAQLEEVYDMYRMVLTTIRNANKAFKAKKAESISTIAGRVMMEIKKVGGKKNLSMKAMESAKSFFWNNMKPVYAFEHIGSDAFTEVFNNVRAGEDVWAVDVTEARDYYLDKSKKHNYDSWDFAKQFKFTSTSGMDFSLNLEQIMSLYAYSKRDQAADHLKKGGIVIDETTEITVKTKLGIPVKFNPTEATAYNISEETLSDIVSKLTDEQKAFVDEMQDYLSTVMGAKGNEVSLEMYGIKLFKEKFYFPLKSATQFMAKAKEQQQGEAKIKNKGFSKETVQKASNPIVLTPFMDVWADHVNEMSMYHAFVLPMEDFYRVYNYKTPTSETLATESVEMFLQNAYGKGATRYIDQLLKDLNGGAMSDPRETFAKSLTSKFKKAKVMASLSVVIQQPSAIGRAFALVNPKYFRPTKDGMNHDELWSELKQYAPVAIIKEMGYFDTGMGMSTKDFIKSKEYSTFREKAKAIVTDSNYRDEIISKAPALADELTWCAIWNAVKRETVSTHKDLRPGSEEFMKAAGERFTEVITKTQVYDSVLARSANMRSKTGLMNMVTSFMAEPTTTINMVNDAILKAKRGNKAYAAKAIASVSAAIILNNALVALVYAMRDDDEDETYLEKYMQSFVSGMIDDTNGLTYYPYLRDMWSILQGYDVERADMSIVSDFADAAKGLIKAYSSEDGDVVGAWHDLVGAMANIGGVPLDNFRREINGAINFVSTIARGDDTTWGSLGDAVSEAALDTIPIVGLFAGDSKTDNLYDAIIDGDKVYVERLKNSYVDKKGNFDQTKYDTAVRKALRENDPRIEKAAKARFSGDFDRYKKLFMEIKDEGIFSFDNIMGAINAEINALEKKAKEDTTKPTEEDAYDVMFTVDDYYASVVGKDQASSKFIYEDLVADKMAEGYLKHEAEDAISTSLTTEIGDHYKDGDITRDEALRLLHENTNNQGEYQVKKWDFELEYGFSWGERVRKYRLDKISEDDLIDSVMDIEGETREAAEAYIDFLDLEMDNADIDITANDAESYFEYAEPAGIDIEVYLDYKSQVSGIKGEDKDGKTISGSKKKKVLAVIHSLPISRSQKDALYRAAGYSEKDINDAPWR